MAEEFDIYDWKQPALQQCAVMGKMYHLEESLLCSICQELLTNPHSLKCGHTYCSYCIRGHMDTTIGTNSASSNTCPICKKSCDRSELRPNKAMENTVLVYKAMRNDLLRTLQSGMPRGPAAGDGDTGVSYGSNDSSSSSSSAHSRSKGHVEMKHIAAKVLHGLNKPKVLQHLLELCQSAKKVNCAKPLSWDGIVEEVNRAERAAKKPGLVESKRVEALHRGKIDDAAMRRFRELTQLIRGRSSEPQDSYGASQKPPSQPQLTKGSQGALSASGKGNDELSSPDAAMPTEESQLDIRCSGPWRVVLEEGGEGRLFFYHTETKTAQFAVPAELSHINVETFRHLHKASFDASTADSGEGIGLVATVAPSVEARKRSSPSSSSHGGGGKRRSCREDERSSAHAEAATGEIISISGVSPTPAREETGLSGLSQLQNGWTCSVCTFDNPSIAVPKCDMCDAPNPRSRPPTRTAGLRALNPHSGSPGIATWPGRPLGSRGADRADVWIESKARSKRK